MLPISWPADNYMITLSIGFFIQKKGKRGGKKREPLSASIALFTVLPTSYSENISFLSFQWSPLIFFPSKQNGCSFCLACASHLCCAFQWWKVLLWPFCRRKIRTMAVGQWVGNVWQPLEGDSGCLGHCHKQWPLQNGSLRGSSKTGMGFQAEHCSPLLLNQPCAGCACHSLGQAFQRWPGGQRNVVADLRSLSLLPPIIS